MKEKILNFLGLKSKLKETNEEIIKQSIDYFNKSKAKVFFVAGIKPDNNIIFSASQLDNKELAKALRKIANSIEFKKIKK